jgi:RND superfamily putative drug exporter
VPFALVVVGLSVVLLTMVFRSIFVPVSAALGFLLSVAAATGATVAIFQWGWFADLLHVIPGPILSFLPILLIAVLFGLAMDYQVFLVSGMREEYVKTGDARASVIVGFAHSARVVTAAALIMFFVFFAFVPEGTGAIKGIAFALALGVFFDAFLVRMTLIPAAMTIAGRAAWWVPRWLERVLPNVDIEGEGLRRHQDDVVWASTQTAAISAEGLRIGTADAALGPIDLSVPAGAILVAAGRTPARRVFAATLAGRIDPVAGRLQVLGFPLPSESARVMRTVALADAGRGGEVMPRSLTVGELIRDRLQLAQPWYRVRPGRQQMRHWLERLNRALSSGRPAGGGAGAAITADTPVSSLTDLQRAAVQVAAALADHPLVVFADLGDSIPAGDDGREVCAVLAGLAPVHTTLILGAPYNADAGPSVSDRRMLYLDLHSFDREAAAR